MEQSAKEYQVQGSAMMGEKNFAKAKEYFTKAIEIDANPELYIDLGNATASLGEYDNAIEAFNKVLLLEPDNGEVYFDLGSVYLLQNKIKKTIEYYNKAEEKGFRNPILYTNFAAIYRTLGDSQMEIRNYTKAIEANPLRGDLYISKINVFLELKRYHEALNTLDDLKKILPDAFEAYDMAAKIYQSMGDSKKAESILDEGLKKFPEDMFLRLSKIQLYVANGNVESAKSVISDMKAQASADRFTRQIKLQEVAVASLENQQERVKALLEEIISEEGENQFDEQCRYMLMMTCALQEDNTRGLEAAREIEQHKSDSLFYMTSLYYIGVFLKKLNQEEDARLQFKKASKQLRELCLARNTHYECYIYRALCHKELGEYEKAVELAEYIEQLQPERADGNVILADIYKEMGEEEKSKEQYAIAQKKDPRLQLGR